MKKRTEDFVCIIDLGSSGVKILGAKLERGKIKQTFREKCSFDKVCFDEKDLFCYAGPAIAKCMDVIEQKLGYVFNRVWLTGRIGETSSKLFILKKSFKEPCFITEDLLRILLDDKFSKNDDSKKCMLHMFPIQYLVDNSVNKDLINVQAQNISAIFHSININAVDMENRIALLNNVYLEPEELIDEMTGISFILPPEFLENGVLVVDMGAYNVNFGLFNNGKLLVSDRIDLYGGEYLTNALMEKLQTTRDVAEQVKIEYGKLDDVNSLQDLVVLDKDNNECYFPIPVIHDLIVNWTMELFRDIYENLETREEKSLIPFIQYVILVGDGANLRGTEEVAKLVFNLSAIKLESPEYVMLMGVAKKICDSVCEKMLQTEKNNLEWAQKIDNCSAILHNLFSKKIRKIRNPIMPSVFSFNNYLSPILYNEFEKNKIDILHLDIMDGHYVQNTMGSVDDVKTIRKLTNAYLHTHLMVENPLAILDDYINAGSDEILISSDSNNALEAVKRVKELGKNVGVVIKPGIKLKDLQSFFDIVDEIMVMTVVPGASGQAFMDSELIRVQKLFDYRANHQKNWLISVDGGINADTIEQAKLSGADRFVIGSYLAKADSIKKALKKIKL